MNCLMCRKPTKIFFKVEKNLCVTSNSIIKNKGIALYKCVSCQHIQKQLTEEYIREVKKLYSDYKIYDITGGREQVKFMKNNLPRARSSINIDSINKLPSSGNLLDVGSGNGAFLKAFSVAHKNWDLYAQDLYDDEKEDICKISGVKDFFSIPLPEIKIKFDLISLIHSFEHMDQPILILKNLKKLLKTDGLLLIQVPNIEKNMFDAIIYFCCQKQYIYLVKLNDNGIHYR